MSRYQGKLFKTSLMTFAINFLNKFLKKT